MQPCTGYRGEDDYVPESLFHLSKRWHRHFERYVMYNTVTPTTIKDTARHIQEEKGIKYTEALSQSKKEVHTGYTISEFDKSLEDEIYDLVSELKYPKAFGDLIPWTVVEGVIGACPSGLSEGVWLSFGRNIHEGPLNKNLLKDSSTAFVCMGNVTTHIEFDINDSLGYKKKKIVNFVNETIWSEIECWFSEEYPSK